MSQIAILLLSIVPHDPGILRESHDSVELNHFYDEHGRLVFDQVIWWDWSCRDERYQVVDWRLVKQPWQVPVMERGGYRCLWLDGEQMRCVYSRSYQESWLQYDPELAEREILPKEARRGLRERKTTVQSRPM